MREKKVIVLNDPNFNSGSLFDRRVQSVEEINNKKKDNITLLTPQKEKKKRGRKPGKSRMYFTPETEDYIVKYNKERNPEVRNKIYNEHLKKPLDKLAENIINTFSFSYIPDAYEDIKSEVISHMLLNIDKYKQELGRAFSYFSIMAKNYLIISNNQYYSELKTNYSIESDASSAYFEFDIVDDAHDKYNKNQEAKEFIRLMVEYWEKNASSTFKKKRDLDIAVAVIELFKNVGSLEFFNKKALYLLIREMTGHKTQYITRVINKMQVKYPEIRKSYTNHGYIKEIEFFKKKK